MKKYMMFIGVCFLIYSCTSNDVVVNENNQRYKLTKEYKLVETGEKVFVLDSESQPRNRCIQLYKNKENDSLYYTFYNEYNNSIYVYDYHSASYLNKIQLYKEGNNGVYPHRSGYYISSFDTIYFYSMTTQRLYVLNYHGEKYRTINLRANLSDNVIPPTVRVSAESPIYKINQNLYLCGSINEEFEDADSLNNLIITKINSYDDNCTPHLSVGYPDSYRKGNWGDAYFRNTFWCYNEINKSFYISFPNDHYIYKTDLNKVERIYAGSSYADNISSIDHPKYIPLPKKKRIAHYLSSYYYRAITYDSYRNIYYRIVEHPWINYNPDERPWKKPISVIVFDSNFHFIGETLLSKDYNLSADNFMITSEGLLLRKETDNEDEMKYTIFKLEKND